MSEWVSTSAAAAALGISEKTVWRRAKSGQLLSRKVSGKRGGLVWQIAIDSTAQADNRNSQATTETDNQNGQPDSRNGQNQSFERETDRTVRNAQPDKSDRQSDELTARLLAQMEREIERLERDKEAWKAQAEEANRNAATATAALREYIKAMPKAITSGAAESAPEQPKRAAKRTDEQTHAPPADASQNGPDSGAETSYAAIADWLEKEMK
jgi:flagellar biosynthesis GTPase FlhF